MPDPGTLNEAASGVTPDPDSPLAHLHRQDLAEMFEFLDDLRESGATNMFGARPYLIAEFPEHRRVAASVLSAWMGSFSRDLSAQARADSFLGPSAQDTAEPQVSPGKPNPDESAA